MLGCCHVRPWLIEFSGVELTYFKLPRSTVLTEVSSPPPKKKKSGRHTRTIVVQGTSLFSVMGHENFKQKKGIVLHTRVRTRYFVLAVYHHYTLSGFQGGGTHRGHGSTLQQAMQYAFR